MGYVIEPKAATEFIAAKIDLPLFQRAPSWTPSKNFNLTLSVFKGYPVGVVVVSAGPFHTANKVLLDGRQRREALTQMLDPQNLYDWAVKALKLGRKHTELEFEDAYWIAVEDFLGDHSQGDEEPTSGVADETLAESDESPSSAPDDDPDDASATPTTAPESLSIKGLKPLEELLRVLLLCRGGAFTAPFNFAPYLTTTKGLKFFKTSEGGKPRISSSDLCQWIRDSEPAWSAAGSTPDALAQWLADTYNVQDESALRTHIQKEWAKIQARVTAVLQLESRLADTRIGYIEVAAPTTADEMKIFELINTSGTALTSAEILSARADWNKEVADPPEAVKVARASLYKSLKIDPRDSEVRRWDVAATLIERLSLDWVFGTFDSKKTAFEQRTQLGFQLYAGHYLGRIMKDDLGDLGSAKVPWDSLELDHIIEKSLAAASSVPLSLWESWSKSGFSLLSAMSAAVAMDFILLLARDWIRKERPSKGADAKAVRRNAATILDRLVFEYLDGQWGHAGDSRLARDLQNLEGSPKVMVPVSTESWNGLLTKALGGEPPFNLSPTKGKTAPTKPVRLLLLYFCMLRGLDAPTIMDKGYAVDHIIPEAAFEASPVGSQYRNRITNLALVPGAFNAKKSDRALNDLPADHRPWLVSKIAAYEQIPESDFDKYSDPSGAEALHEFRSEVWSETFGKLRTGFLK